MLTALAVLSFIIAVVVHDGGGAFLSLDWAGWMLVGLALFAAGHLYPWAPWQRT